IRSMMQAVYQAENIGHFGLGYSEYTHFTSPIRRYPDLLVHRAIRFLLRSKKGNRHLRKSTAAGLLERSEIYPYNPRQIAELGDNCSVTERRADSASYDVIDWLKCEYMQSRVGDEFDGTIASVTGFGLFVELDGIYIEGLVHITALDNDYYHFDAISHVLTGERTGKRYHMGDSVRVKVAAVSLDERKIDLVMVGAAATSGRKRGSSKKSSRKTSATGRSSAKNTSSKRSSRDQKDSDNRRPRKSTNKSAGNVKGEGKGKGKGKGKGNAKARANAKGSANSRSRKPGSRR
ncbi:MAG: RNB domain-containing ribonuclease, partial [Gammaproteobacteria bacterium]|nr:RNB domain-containing ribonuclease [Gammaproteobacteria bacterium]